ncbi:ABC transporter substrate-binding protein [Aquibacillus salsiterrae]|uniref:Extracellular solute-binding protein n=1 Tax=Aquibacillus salsiterrae TaxID=2950439 RepID=A0A9X4ADZ3_9BACI|nr:extracellular solute-binding protein [Aquibacillus salsiterrae]MDC3416081.1 extracellular solute-binding protein [Aquibacillus salsiterrae]
MKKFLLMLLSIAFVLVMAACSSGSDENASGDSKGDSSETENTGDSLESSGSSDDGGSDEGSDEQITLRMAWWGSQSRHDMTNEIIKLYEEQNPNIKIQAEFTGFSGYFEKMAAQAAGNNLPDIMQQNFGEYVNQYASQDLLEDLGPYVESGAIDLEGVSDTIIDAGKVGGTLVGIPTGTNALSATISTAALEEAGIEVPTNDWTWQDFVDIATEYKEKTGKYGARLLEPGNMFDYYVREQGYHLFNEDGTGLGYDDDQVLVDYFTMVKDMVDAEVMPGYDVISQIKGLEDELIVRGEAAMDLSNWSNQIGTLEKTAGTPIEARVLPGEGNDKGMFLKPSMLWSIPKSSEYKEEAAKFINFFTNTLEVFEIIGTDRGIPIKPEIAGELKPTLSDVDQKVFDYIEYVTDNSSPADTNFPPAASEVLSKLEDIDEMIMYGEMSPEDGATQFRQQAESILGN